MENARAVAINTELHRNIKDGSFYQSFMPYSDCSSVKLADGNTKVAIENMAAWSKKYTHHTKELAVVFANKSLKDTCEDIHSFLYNHFQYKIDGFKQNLRSPACSWATRSRGIDCKSYSIFASTLLNNLGIKHFLRRIKQAPNEGFSHVYVIVPINQKHPKKLKDGYFTIDGTLPTVKEPKYYSKSDVFMEAELPIYGLAGLRNPAAQQAAPAGGFSNALAESIKPILDVIVQGLLNAVMGCDDADYEMPIIQLRVKRDLLTVLEKKVTDLEEAINWGNRARIQHVFNDIFKNIDLGIEHLRNETAYSQRDECIAGNLAEALKYTEKIKDVFDTVFENFKKTNTKYTIEEFEKTASTKERTLYFVVGQDDNPIQAPFRYIVLRDKNSTYGIDPIFPFEANSLEWLTKNVRHLTNAYGKTTAEAYKKEVSSVLNEVLELRDKVHLGGVSLYYFEQPLQREMYKIWLKYDKRYIDYLKKEAQSLKTANELALKDYQRRFEIEIEKDKEAKKKKAFKKQLGIASVAFAGFLVVKK